MYPKTQQEADRRLAHALYSSSQQKYIFKKIDGNFLPLPLKSAPKILNREERGKN